MDLFFIGEILLSILLGFGLGYILFLNKLLMERKSSEEQNIKFRIKKGIPTSSTIIILNA